MTEERNTVSACLIARDMEKEIPSCLDTLRPVVDEIVLVDFGSSDHTRQVAREGGAKVMEVPFRGDFALLRNAAVQAAKGEWILMLNGDERLECDGYDAFRKPLTGSHRLGFVLTRINDFGKDPTMVLKLRLFRNRPEIRYSGIVYERVDPSLAALSGNFEVAVGRHPARLFVRSASKKVKDSRKDRAHLDLLRRQIEKEPEDPYYWFRFAIHPFALRHHPREVEAALMKAWDLLRLCDPKGTVYSFTPEVAARHILTFLTKEDITSAFTIACEAGELAWFSPNLHYVLALCAMAAGNLQIAAAPVEGAMADKGNALPCAPMKGITSYLSLSVLSEIRWMEKKKEEAKRLFIRAADLCDRELANTFFGPAWTLKERGYDRIALMHLKKRARQDPKSAFPWLRGSEILEAVGETDAGREWRTIGEARTRDAESIQEQE